MKQYITLLVLIFSFTVSANDRSIHFVNTTPHKFDFSLITTTDDDNFSYPIYSMVSHMSIPSYSNVMYEDATAGMAIPYYIFTTKWYYDTATDHTQADGYTAFTDDGLTQKWAGMKFSISSIAGFSGGIGPYFGINTFTAGGVTVTWIASDTRVTIMIT